MFGGASPKKDDLEEKPTVKVKIISNCLDVKGHSTHKCILKKGAFD